MFRLPPASISDIRTNPDTCYKPAPASELGLTADQSVISYGSIDQCTCTSLALPDVAGELIYRLACYELAASFPHVCCHDCPRCAQTDWLPASALWLQRHLPFYGVSEQQDFLSDVAQALGSGGMLHEYFLRVTKWSSRHGPCYSHPIAITSLLQLQRSNESPLSYKFVTCFTCQYIDAWKPRGVSERW